MRYELEDTRCLRLVDPRAVENLVSGLVNKNCAHWRNAVGPANLIVLIDDFIYFQSTGITLLKLVQSIGPKLLLQLFQLHVLAPGRETVL